MPVIFNDTQGWVVLDQIRTKDRKRIIKTKDFLDASKIIELKKILRETYVDQEVLRCPS
ncbi:type II toxin-antitoxin system PemK/MazF family toxin [Aquirufa nivalisilvae]